MSTISPLISCICVTRNKHQKLQQAIACFKAQSYENKQLVLLYEDDDILTESFLTALPFDQQFKIIKVKVQPKLTLGDLRNLAINSSDGEFVCQWDDDDWFHVERLRFQYESSKNSGKLGSILKKWLIHDSTCNKLYISHSRNWEGSLLCSKELFLSYQYDSLSKGEDTSLIERLIEKEHLHFIVEITPMYVYIYHGKNTWDSVHFNAIFNCSTLIDLPLSFCGEIFEQPPLKASRLLDQIVWNPESVKNDPLSFLTA